MYIQKDVRSRDIGLETGLLLARYLLDTENLHYGYWMPGVEVHFRNLPAAQERYTEFLLSHVPAGAKSVLDVGCGAGVTAEKLLERGLEVECVAPESGLLEAARKRLGERARVHAARFQDFAPTRKFDMVMFSESFQYIPFELALPHALKFIDSGGYVLICDFFKVKGKKKSPIGGGHKIYELEKQAAQLGCEILTDIDITEQTAPNLDLVDDFMRRVGKPGYEMLMEHAMASYPRTTKLVRWWKREQIDKVEHKYFSGLRTGKTFAEYKTYRLLLLRRK
ncbi:MAG: class I SAM-dependent methyltransferase [Planctomycetes bacterium]|nr:class I SAM-dependent methyltransferase [Planctomycetota bacterium]MCW8136113.1 class I SAM-dependent methyltransferase [Planctomycetota bacterium]